MSNSNSNNLGEESNLPSDDSVLKNLKIQRSKVLNPVDKFVFLNDKYYDIEDLNCTNIGQVDEIRLEILNEINRIIMRSPYENSIEMQNENSEYRGLFYSLGHK